MATAEAFNAAVTQCVEDAAPEAVHGLRTGSRRLQATLEAMLREEAAASLQQAAKGWLRQLKQVRRAAGTVRDLDVFVRRDRLEHVGQRLLTRAAREVEHRLDRRGPIGRVRSG